MNRPRRKRMKPLDPMLSQVKGSIQATFGPMERLLRDLETGTMHIQDHQVAVFLYGPHNQFYPMADAVRGLVDVFQAHAVRRGKPIYTHALERLIAEVEQLDFPSMELIAACRENLMILRRRASLMRRSDVQSLIVGTQIQAEIEHQSSLAQVSA